jgi:hypothetical protein
MTGLPPHVLARLRARARAEHEKDDERSGERAKPAFEPSPDQKLRWLSSSTLRAPVPGSVDVVTLRRRRRA